MTKLFEYSALWEYQAAASVPLVDPGAEVVPVADWLGPEPAPFGENPNNHEYPVASDWPLGEGLWIRRALVLDKTAAVLLSGQIENACYVYFDGVYVGAINPAGAGRTDVPYWNIVVPASLATAGTHEVAILCHDEDGTSTGTTYVFCEAEYLPEPWTYWPRAPMGETLEWLTDVIISDNGTEDRAQLRVTPRQSVSMTSTIPFADQPRVKNILWQNRAGQWLVPFWPHVQEVGAIPAGEWTLTLPTEYVDFRDYSLALIWQSPTQFQIVGIDRITDDTTIVLTQPTEAFTAALVMPIRRGFSPGDPSRRFNGRRSTVQMTFVMEENRQLTVGAPAQYLGSDIYYDVGLLEGGGLDETLTSEFDLHDEALGRVSYGTEWLHPRPRRPFRRLVDTLEEAWGLREWFHRRAGRLRPFWHPSFEADLIPVSTGALTTTLLVRSDEYLRSAADRDHIAVQTAAGWLPRAITNATQIDPATVQLTLSSSLAINASAILRVSWLGLWRIDADRVEFNWGAARICQIGVPVLELDP